MEHDAHGRGAGTGAQPPVPQDEDARYLGRRIDLTAGPNSARAEFIAPLLRKDSARITPAIDGASRAGGLSRDRRASCAGHGRPMRGRLLFRGFLQPPAAPPPPFSP